MTITAVILSGAKCRPKVRLWHATVYFILYTVPGMCRPVCTPAILGHIVVRLLLSSMILSNQCVCVCVCVCKTQPNLVTYFLANYALSDTLNYLVPVRLCH